MWLRFLCAVGVELIYAVTSRAWLPLYYSGIELELVKTFERLLSLLVFLLLFRGIIFSKEPQAARALHPLVGIALTFLFMVPVVVGNYGLPGLTAQFVFAATSVVVALKEEVFYRGIFQNLIEARLGTLWAVVLSNIAFTLYHYGAQPFTPWVLIQLFSAGCVFGLIYAATGSLMLAVAIHALNDALWSFTPILHTPMTEPLGSVLLVVALFFCAMWTLRSNKALQSDVPRPAGAGRG